MIKNIIFDFGGVLYDIDHHKTRDAFKELGINDFNTLYGHAIQTRIFEDMEIGLVSPSDFRAEIRKYLPKETTDQQIDVAWNALLIGFKPERIEFLEKVGKNYRLFLLSNTSQIHYQYYMDELKAINLYEKFNRLFEKLYFSHLIGMRKPDEKIFEFVTEDCLIKPEETAFIDDYDLNINAANAFGINGLFLKPGQDVSDLFSETFLLKA